MRSAVVIALLSVEVATSSAPGSFRPARAGRDVVVPLYNGTPGLRGRIGTFGS
jgi:hypothetical protein